MSEGRYAALGIQFALTFMIFGAVGYWLDQQLGTRPWLLLVGIFLGATGGFVKLVRSVPPPRGKRPSGEGGSEPE